MKPRNKKGIREAGKDKRRQMSVRGARLAGQTGELDYH